MQAHIQHVGVPNRAEKIPFEPDLGNTSGGKRASICFFGGIFLNNKGMPHNFFKKVKLSGVL